MPTSNDIWSQIQANQSILDEYLGEAGQSSEKFQDAINEKYKNNIGAIKNAAGLESKAYSMPGDLMEQYDQEFGGQMGLGSMSRMNSILKNIGQQFGISNAAWGVVDNAKLRQEELLKQMNNRFNTELQARQQKHNNLLPLWQQLYAAEQARRGSGSGSNAMTEEDWRKLILEAQTGDVNTSNTGNTGTNTSGYSPPNPTGPMPKLPPNSVLPNNQPLPPSPLGPNKPSNPFMPTTSGGLNITNLGLY